MPSEILMEFIEDSAEHLAAAGQHLLALEKDIDQPDELNGLLRRVHTIKGNAGFLDLRYLYELLHKTENILQGIREEKPAAWPSGLVDVQLQVLDTVEAMINNLSDGGNDHVGWLDELLGTLDGLEREIELTAPPREIDDPLERPLNISEKLISDPVPVRIEPPKPDPVYIKPAPIKEEMAGPPEKGSGLEEISAKAMTIIESVDIPDPDSPFPVTELLERFKALHGEYQGVWKPNVERALNLVIGYLAEVSASSLSSSGARAHLAGLIDNFFAWLETDQSSGNGAILVIKVTARNLQDDGQSLHRQVEADLARHPRGLIFDLHDFQTMYSRQIGILISKMKWAGQETRVAMILDPKRQAGLQQVFRVMGLDKIFPMFPGLDDVEKAWASGV